MRGVTTTIEKARKWIPTVSHFFLFLRVALWSLMVPLLLRTLSMDKLMKVLEPGKQKDHKEDMQAAKFIDVYVRKVLRLNPVNEGKICLKRSLVLYRFLRMYNIPARFMVGVKKEQGKLTGHAWIEIRGQHFQDPLENANYTVTFSYPKEDGN